MSNRHLSSKSGDQGHAHLRQVEIARSDWGTEAPCHPRWEPAKESGECYLPRAQRVCGILICEMSFLGLVGQTLATVGIHRRCIGNRRFSDAAEFCCWILLNHFGFT